MGILLRPARQRALRRRVEVPPPGPKWLSPFGRYSAGLRLTPRGQSRAMPWMWMRMGGATRQWAGMTIGKCMQGEYTRGPMLISQPEYRSAHYAPAPRLAATVCASHVRAAARRGRFHLYGVSHLCSNLTAGALPRISPSRLVWPPRIPVHHLDHPLVPLLSDCPFFSVFRLSQERQCTSMGASTPAL